MANLRTEAEQLFPLELSTDSASYFPDYISYACNKKHIAIILIYLNLPKFHSWVPSILEHTVIFRWLENAIKCNACVKYVYCTLWWWPWRTFPILKKSATKQALSIICMQFSQISQENMDMEYLYKIFWYIYLDN